MRHYPTNSPQAAARVLALCVAVVESDDHVADGESIVRVSAIEQWGLHHHMLGEPSAP
jgi:hypothetical protein